MAIPIAGEALEQLDFLYIYCGNVKWFKPVENSLAIVLKKTDILWYINPTPLSIYPPKMENLCLLKTLYNCKKAEYW